MYSIIPSVFHGYASPFFVGSLVNEETFYVNPAGTKMFGVEGNLEDFTKLFHGQDTCFFSWVKDCLKQENTCHLYNYKAKKEDGSEILVDLQVGYYNEEKTEFFLEMTPQNPEKVHQNYLAALQRLTEDTVFRIDLETETIYHNDETMNGYGIPSGVPHFVETWIEKGLIKGDKVADFQENIKKLLQLEIKSFETRFLTQEGSFPWHEIRCEPVLASDGKVCHLLGRLRNIQSGKEMGHQAYHDLMTGALHQDIFQKESQEILADSPRSQHHAMVVLDLENFKDIESQFGRPCVDALLKEVGTRLKAMIRGNDLIGRVGVDEFALFLRDVDEDCSAVLRAHFILSELEKPWIFQEETLSIKASVGVSVFPAHGNDYDTMKRKASLAVEQSKERGTNMVTLFTIDG